MKIAILGAAKTSRHLAPFDDAEWEIWTCSPRNQGAFPRVDKWFEIHGMNFLAGRGHPEYMEWLKGLPFVYMQKQEPDYPGSVAFPKDEMIEQFGPFFFTSSIAWMLALAISQKPEAIGLWGVDMIAAEEEYSGQRYGCHHFIQLAKHLGIEIIYPRECKIMTPPELYGFNKD